MTRLEAAEMRFLRSVTGYTRLDKIRSEVTRRELQILGIQAVGTKFKRNFISHLERTENKRHTQLQDPRTKRSWTPEEKMATRRCRNTSNDLIDGE